MLKRLLLVLLTFLTFQAIPGIAAAAIDINKADKAELESVTGIGPATADRILAERKKGGNFKDWTDLETRVKGMRAAATAKLSKAGLTVNGESRAPATGKSELKKTSTKASDKNAGATK